MLPERIPAPTVSLIQPIESIQYYWVYSIYPPRKKQHSLLVLPFVNAILNFANKFFEMFTKKQSRHPHQVFQVFQVFRVFQVFQVRFWTTKPPDFGPNPNKAEKSLPTHLRHLMAT